MHAMLLTSLSRRLAIPFSASSFDSSNFSRASPISSSVMLLPVEGGDVEGWVKRRGRRRKGQKVGQSVGSENRASRKWREGRGREGKVMRCGREENEKGEDNGQEQGEKGRRGIMHIPLDEVSDYSNSNQ